MRRVRWSVAARSDLSKIARWSESRWGQDQRDRYLAEIRDPVSQLRLHPEMGPEYGSRRPGLRRLTVGVHVLFYRYDDARIVVVRVLDQRMDIETRLGEAPD